MLKNQVGKMNIIILGGFLGSGKTTLLERLLKYNQEQNIKTCVLMNEYGKQSVDTNIIDQAVPLKELLNGCICCDLKVDVEIQIHQLYLEHQPECMIIECSGVAHPVEILDACLSPVLTPFSNVQSLIGIVDATKIRDKAHFSPQISRLFIEQIKYCSYLLINKCDLLSDVEKEHVQKFVKEINPDAEMLLTQYCEINDIQDVFKNSVSINDQYDTGGVRQHSGIQSYTYEFKNPVDSHLFVEWLKTLPKNIFRVKGFLSFKEQPETVFLFQYAYGVPEYREILLKLPRYIVVIGEQLDKASLATEFEAIENT
ncbi:GTP-binding protein [Macrococcus sp. DPC7161]|uniref:CobW family GTP-binding protein n=1 Tax=Macrococcus sp. DPC7161 TaxID=2507060 RepID=UPI00100C1E42|nr:GTP-binding protein [Macrococcus sp. DPC7161]RXK19123.1 GTP-binding protein [Macrococcus sp. DPC7161]